MEFKQTIWNLHYKFATDAKLASDPYIMKYKKILAKDEQGSKSLD